MPKNEPLRLLLANLLTNIAPLLANPDTKKAAEKAFDALIQADLSDAKNFRQALFAHKAFWDRVDPSLVEAGQHENNNYLSFNGTTDGAAPNDFKALQRLGALIRIKLGLTTAPGKVLKGIRDASDEATQRQALTTPEAMKHFGDLTKTHEWSSNSEPLLTGEMLGQIKNNTEALVAENTRLELCNKIYNFEIAKVFKNSKIPLDAQSLERINTRLRGLPGVPADAAIYKNFVTQLANDCGQTTPEQQRAFYHAFGVNPNDDTYTNQTIRNDIDTQHTHNQVLITAYNRDDRSATDQAILAVFLPLSKNKPFPPSTDSITALLEDFRKSTSVEDFAKKAEARQTSSRGVHPYHEQFPPDWKKALTPARFQQLKKEQRTADSAIVARRDDVNQEVETALKEISTQIEAAKTEKSRFKTVKDLDPEELFSPAFQEEGQYRAKKYRDLFKTLAKKIDQMQQLLNIQKAKLEELKNSIAPGALTELSEKIEAQKKEADELLKYYQDLHQQFYGDTGFLKTMQEAIEGKDVLFTNFTMEVDDFPESDLAKHLTTPTAGALNQAPPGLPAIEIGRKNFSTLATNKLKSDRCREYKVGGELDPTSHTPQIIGNFVEQRNDRITTMTVTKFPTNPEDCVKVTLAAVSQALSTLTEPPSERNRITIRGDNPEQVQWLYAACKALGYDDKVIQIDNNRFDRKQEKGWFFGFGYARDAKAHHFTTPEAQNLMKKPQDLLSTKFADKTPEDLAAVQKEIKKGLNQTREKEVEETINKNTAIEEEQSNRYTLS